MLRSCDVRSVRSVALDLLHVAAVAAVARALMATDVDRENFMMVTKMEDEVGMARRDQNAGEVAVVYIGTDVHMAFSALCLDQAMYLRAAVYAVPAQ